jgi:hypothetical protein
MTAIDLLRIYEGSNGDATKALYTKLEALGPAGVVAMNLFRASKCSARAKVYRGGGFRRDAYDRKNWSIANLCTALNSGRAQAPWGWKQDPHQEFHCWVLYVDLPTGQTSFHSATRGEGPDYPGDWDGVPEASAGRILRWIENLFQNSNIPLQ